MDFGGLHLRDEHVLLGAVFEHGDGRGIKPRGEHEEEELRAERHDRQHQVQEVATAGVKARSTSA
jgi:hypothetical protein